MASIEQKRERAAVLLAQQWRNGQRGITPTPATVPQRGRWSRIALWVAGLSLLVVFFLAVAIATYAQVEHGSLSQVPQVRDFILQAGQAISPTINRENAEATWREAEVYVLQASGADWNLPEAADSRRHLLKARHLLDRGELDNSRHQSKIAQARAEAGWAVLEARGQEDIARAERAFAKANEVVPGILWKRTFTAEAAHSYWTAARLATTSADRERFANLSIESAYWAATDETNWQPMPIGWTPYPLPPSTPGHDGRG